MATTSSFVSLPKSADATETLRRNRMLTRKLNSDVPLTKVSPDGVNIRDEKVFRFAREKDIPRLTLTSGGYMKASA